MSVLKCHLIDYKGESIFLQRRGQCSTLASAVGQPNSTHLLWQSNIKSISCDILLPELFRLNLIKSLVLTLILQEIQGRREQVKQYHKGSKVHKVVHSKERLAWSQQITVKESKREGGCSTLKETWMASRWNAMCGLWLESDLKKLFWGQLGNFSHGLGITWC